MSGKKRSLTTRNSVDDKLRLLFFRGSYAKILHLYQTNPSVIPKSQRAYLLGALSFQGETLEAEEFFKQQASSMNTVETAASLFYLGIGFTRKSQYKKARHFFKRNQMLHQNNSEPAVQFYVLQGIAFYLYFIGQFRRAARLARKSLRMAVAAQDTFGKVLAQDLRGHSLAQAGQVQLGLSFLRSARKQALQIGNQAFAAATEVSYLLYQAQFGFQPQSILAELNKMLSLFSIEDSYSRANITLELARQLTLRGRFSESQKQLNEIAPAIYGQQNRRQEITLNIRWAENALLQGYELTARQHLRSAQHCLVREVDRNFEVQILELELKLLRDEGSAAFKEKKQRLLELAALFASQTSQNRIARKKWGSQGKTSDETLGENRQEDPIHLLLQKIEAKDPHSLSLILESQYLSWLFKILPVHPGQNTFYLGLERSSLTIFVTEGISHQQIPVLSWNILEALSQGPLSKASLVEKVWGYQYHPLRHDSLVYAAMSSLRKQLGTASGSVLTTEDGYCLHSDLQILRHSKLSAEISTYVLLNQTVQSVPGSTAPLPLDLNHRQIQALELLKTQRFLSTQTYQELMQTTAITASRDLSSLKKKGYVIKIGSGRATHYTLAKEPL